MTMIEQWGGRKFIFGLLVMLLTFILSLLDMNTATFLAASGVIYGSYIIGNTVSKKIDK